MKNYFSHIGDGYYKNPSIVKNCVYLPNDYTFIRKTNWLKNFLNELSTHDFLSGRIQKGSRQFFGTCRFFVDKHVPNNFNFDELTGKRVFSFVDWNRDMFTFTIRIFAYDGDAYVKATPGMHEFDFGFHRFEESLKESNAVHLFTFTGCTLL